MHLDCKAQITHTVKMANEHVRDKLKQLLERGSNKDNFEEDIRWLQSTSAWINFHCPTLQTFTVKEELDD